MVHPGYWALNILGVIVLVTFIAMLPDIFRYIRISRM